MGGAVFYGFAQKKQLQTLTERTAQWKRTRKQNKKQKTLEQVIEYCKFQRLNAERVGSWVWVSFDEKPDEATINNLKEYGFRYSPRRKKWAHNCGTPSKSAHTVNPWEKYDHAIVSSRAVS